jgi:uncharacterized membrane protein
MINFSLICVVNLTLLAYLEKDEVTGDFILRDWKKNLVDSLGYFQTFVAFIVVISYYVEYRANFIYMLKRAGSKFSSGLVDIGLSNGSLAYGDRKSSKYDQLVNDENFIKKLKTKYYKVNILKFFFSIIGETDLFFRSLNVNGTHLRNLVYLIVSIIGIYRQFFNSLLLLDIISMIPQLTQVLSVFRENKVSLAATLALFFVVLYISSFLSYQYFKEDFISESTDPDDAPDFNLYCETLF